MPASPGSTRASAPSCTNCEGLLAIPEGFRQEALTALIEEESARCARLGEIAQQRQTLAMRIQAGIAGIPGREGVETNDLIAHRQSLAQLEQTLKAQYAELSKVMIHKPREVNKKKPS